LFIRYGCKDTKNLAEIIRNYDNYSNFFPSSPSELYPFGVSVCQRTIEVITPLSPWRGVGGEALEFGAGRAVVLVEAEAELVEVVEDGDEHAEAGNHQQHERPDGQETEMPVEQAAGTDDAEGQCHEHTEAAVVGVDAVVGEVLQEDAPMQRQRMPLTRRAVW